MKNLQYLLFKVNQKDRYVCFHTGAKETYGMVDVVPYEAPDPTIQGKVNYLESGFMEGYFEENFLVTF